MAERPKTPLFKNFRFEGTSLGEEIYQKSKALFELLEESLRSRSIDPYSEDFQKPPFSLSYEKGRYKIEKAGPGKGSFITLQASGYHPIIRYVNWEETGNWQWTENTDVAEQKTQEFLGQFLASLPAHNHHRRVSTSKLKDLVR